AIDRLGRYEQEGFSDAGRWPHELAAEQFQHILHQHGDHHLVLDDENSQVPQGRNSWLVAGYDHAVVSAIEGKGMSIAQRTPAGSKIRRTSASNSWARPRSISRDPKPRRLGL